MITILLATYNSSRYIRELIDSILNQTYKEWNLVVRDDLSKDDTVAIISEYIKQHPSKISILDNHGESKRAYLNFVELLKNVESEYYMFCDHDDVWLPNKIELSIKRMKEIGREIIAEVDRKVRSIKRPEGVSARTGLVYDGHLSPVAVADGYFDAIVPFKNLLGLN